jgi:5-oxopent-3-ene-1,2,5-tricarboxylate decarboxylase/2-hydroxyhepta-2,4-diene-1,7-dioate isomerase
MHTRLSGTVVGALLNDPVEIAAVGEAAFKPPHKAPPAAPVLEVKPRHTLAGDGALVVVPAGEDRLDVGVSLGIVIGSVACRVPVSEALVAVAGYLVAADFSLPIHSHYRPAVRLKARDGFCPLGAVSAAATVAAPDMLGTELRIDGVPVLRASTAGRVRGVAQLIADVTAFMTLQPGDVLLLGRGHALAPVRAGQSVEVAIEGIGTLRCQVVAEAAA